MGTAITVLGEVTWTSPRAWLTWSGQTGMTLESQAEAIRLEVVQSPVISSDERRARVDGRNQWQWVFRTPQASYYVIVPSRRSQVTARK